MFTGKPLPPLRPLPDAVLDAGWAAGFVHIARQSALGFGSDRRIAVAARPAVEIRKDGARVVVLPCTSQDSSMKPDFRELTGLVEWKRPTARRTFACARYEVVPAEALLEKIGALGHPARIQLLDWLKGRY